MISNIKVFLLFVLAISGLSPNIVKAKRLVLQYEKPQNPNHKKLYQVLKSNHKEYIGESIQFLNDLYVFDNRVLVNVLECGFNDSRFIPSQNLICLCYETLAMKIMDYPFPSDNLQLYKRRVFQNVMFTFYHEVGHVIIFQALDTALLDRLTIESLADEFAILSMLWRGDKKWKDTAMISALHFKNKSLRDPGKKYEFHRSDRYRYEQMLTMIHGMSPKSYGRLKDDVQAFEWLTKSSQAFYLDRSYYWEGILRNSLRREYF